MHCVPGRHVPVHERGNQHGAVPALPCGLLQFARVHDVHALRAWVIRAQRRVRDLRICGPWIHQRAQHAKVVPRLPPGQPDVHRGVQLERHAGVDRADPMRSGDIQPGQCGCLRQVRSWVLLSGGAYQLYLLSWSVFILSMVAHCLTMFFEQVGASSALACKKCAAGSYADAPGSTICQGCGGGSYGAVQGATSFAEGCMPCPKGTFSSLSVATVCEPCGPGRSVHFVSVICSRTHTHTNL